MSRVEVMMKQTPILDVVWGVMKASGAGIELAVNLDVSQVVAAETCFVVARMISGKGCMSKVTCPMSFTSFYSL